MATDVEDEKEVVITSSEDEMLCSKLCKKQGDISNRLLDIYDELWDNEQLIHKVYIAGSLDSVIAWDNIVPNPTYVAPRRRKSTIHDESQAEESGVDEDDKLKRNYELEFVNCPAWKIGVEPFTYRYMWNNGRYRAFKLARKLLQSGRVKGGHTEMGKLNPDKRLLQREIQRELRREFDAFVKTEREVSALYRQQELAAANIKHKKKKQEKIEKQSERIEELKSSEYTAATKENAKVDDNKQILSNSSENMTPRSNLSVLSSQTPLPPITVPLLSSKKEETLVKRLSKSLDDLSTLKTENIKKDEKLWHVPASVNESNHAELRGASRRFEWSAQPVIQTSSEPPSRTSPRSYRNNKSVSLAKTDGSGGHRLHSGYRLKRLPTISDFNDNEAESSHGYMGQKEVLLGQGYSQTKASDEHVILQRKGLRKREEVGYKHQNQDSDSLSLTSEPVRLRSPVLQGTAYDIGKLRASAGQLHQPNPDTVNLVGDIRSEYNENQSYTNDHASSTLDSISAHELSVFGKQRGQKDLYLGKDLANIISTKQYVNTKSRTGLNPYLRKPKPGMNAIHQQLFTMEQPDIAETLATFPLNDPTPGLSNHVRRGDVMPEMMVRRAEIALSNKRVI